MPRAKTGSSKRPTTRTVRNVQPGTREQSGSAGRNTPAGATGQQKDTGQGRYGQSGFGGSSRSKTDGERKYERSGANGDPRTKSRSNPGSGRAEADETKKKRPTVRDGRDIPKTG
jgi:hypothetical protein